MTYTWTQTGGVTVTLANDNAVRASFESPDVGIGSRVTLSFQLRVHDGAAFNTDTIDVVVNGVTNTDPTVDAGQDQVVVPQSTVSLSGSAADTDIGDSLNYSWTQLSGTAVTIVDSGSANASFLAPGAGGSGGGGSGNVTVSGKVAYEFVPPNVQCRGLNFNAIQTRPIRAATVQLMDAGETLTFQLAVDDGTMTSLDTVDVEVTGSPIYTTVADDNGDYSFTNVAENIGVRLRVRAELKRSGSPSWNVEVRDNVDDSQNPPPLSARPLYVLDGASFNTGAADLTRDLTATTGWGGSSYTGNRAAAPFAILDAIYSAMQLVLSADPTANFGPLDAFWSVNNTLTSPSDIDAGELSSSFYRGDIDSLFLLGDANIDTEEFDDHVSIHEWGHYFEDVFSRSDSIGGPHRLGESIDARLAFGEGWATAFAAMALDDPLYCDTGAVGTLGGFSLDTEDDPFPSRGWYNELSVAAFIYDLFDTGVDGSDNDSIGFGPIFDTMVGPQASTEAFTTLFSFATELRSMLNTEDRNFVDSQLNRENIETSNIDIWASTQGNVSVAPNTSQDVLPLYTTLPTDGTPINVCVNDDYDPLTDANGERNRDGNKLAQFRYLTFTTTSSARYTVRVTTTTIPPVTADPDDRDQSDPDMIIYRRGQPVAEGQSGEENLEVFATPTLAAGAYVADLQEWRYEDSAGAPQDYPNRICFDVTMNPL
ncbi:MAG: hypothetical protein KJN77_08175 [Gammaproteobacteria bacterium]|nr:hypothetical protein [Gammaproteobacteria bacterium]